VGQNASVEYPLSVLDAILESYPKSKKILIDDVGMDTDEDAGVKMPREGEIHQIFLEFGICRIIATKLSSIVDDFVYEVAAKCVAQFILGSRFSQNVNTYRCHCMAS
jgi:hypothetical protein